MSEEKEKKLSTERSDLVKKIGISEQRKMKARNQAVRSIWSGFAVFGLIGWSVTVPTLLGVMLGIWLDNNYPMERSWTLMLLVIGLFIGCMNAWHWIAEENRDMHKED